MMRGRESPFQLRLPELEEGEEHRTHDRCLSDAGTLHRYKCGVSHHRMCLRCLLAPAFDVSCHMKVQWLSAQISK